ncbi:hypothetical protein FACS1894180_9260 [Bacteroidia bacterium]|nr:hypothetical protein FACS1894180_9260 [Bacteroidia bacterium]
MKNSYPLWAVITTFVLSLLLIAVGWKFYANEKLEKIMEKSKFINPTAKFRISSKFGLRKAPTAGASTNHNGIDIACPTGTQVVAPADGVVKSVYSNNTGGKQLVIEHTEGWRTGYAHLSEYQVVAGQSVTQGQPIAKTGNTGISTGAHLHFTLTCNGVKIDHEKYFYK